MNRTGAGLGAVASAALVVAVGSATLVVQDDDARTGAVVPAAAAAAPPVGPVGPAERALAQRAMRLVDVDPAALGVRVRLAGARSGVRATADTVARVVTLHVRREPAHRLAHDLAHELGHVVDRDRLTTATRERWLRARGARAPWSSGTASDYASGAGDFAEVYAACHAASPEFRSKLAPAPADACGALADLPVRRQR